AYQHPKKQHIVACIILQTKIVKKADILLDVEKKQKKIERGNTLNERVPLLKLAGISSQIIELPQKINVVDEERYNIAAKVAKNEKGELLIHIPQHTCPEEVRVSVGAMLGALLGSKHKNSIDFKANLKTVKKEEEKVKEEMTDWRKNVDAMSGMEGRKKMFGVTAS
uniref:Uncharacterized protein n=1 Tax=Pygocentrus nattereri TaxID=42514 RepID=A0A3B4EAU2_PYGNA